jgi:hypothetical protein
VPHLLIKHLCIPVVAPPLATSKNARTLQPALAYRHPTASLHQSQFLSYSVALRDASPQLCQQVFGNKSPAKDRRVRLSTLHAWQDIRGNAGRGRTSDFPSQER